MNEPPAENELDTAIRGAVFARTVADTQEIVQKYRDVLLSDAAEKILAHLQEEFGNDEQNGQLLTERLAMLKFLLAKSLVHNPPGERAESLERALDLNQQALEVYTRRDYPEHFARTQSDLAYAYLMLGDLRSNTQDIEAAIYHYQEALAVFTRQDFPADWARDNARLGALYRTEDLRGDRAQNLEEAISCFREALKVYTRRDTPEDWAFVQLGLGDAYCKLLRGDRAHNLEEAVKHLRNALEVLTHRDFREQWGIAQLNLGNAYRDRIRGDRAQNLEEAINHSQQALEVYTRQESPKDWAGTKNNLGLAYWQRLRGDRAQNLEEAISCFREALEAATRRDFPELWAGIKNSLALAYRDRIRGDRAQNLEGAINHLQDALDVFTRQGSPEGWARIHTNLGTCYRDRIRGDKAQNLEEAINHYRRALEVRSHRDFPEQWAGIQFSLGVVYRDRIRGDKAQNLEEAINHLREALKVYTRNGYPEKWAMTKHSLANAYSQRIRGDKAQNFEEAINHYRGALKVRTHRDFPEQWAMTQHNLGMIYQERLSYRAQDLEWAIHHYQEALKVRTPQTFPQDCHDTAYNLGILLYDERRFSEARDILTMAHRAVEALRGEIQREGAKRTLAEENATLYARLVNCCLLQHDEEAAFEYAATGKGRAFVDLLATARFDPSGASSTDPKLAKDWRKARELRQQIGNMMTQLFGRTSPSTQPKVEIESLETTRTKLHVLQADYDALWEEMSYKYPALTATQRVPTLTLEVARKLATNLEASLVEYFEHANGWCAFVVSPEGVNHVPLPGVNDDLRERMLGWVARIESPAGRGKLSYGPLRQLHTAVIAPLRDYLPAGEAAFLGPFSWLHLVPLGAALDPVSGRYAANDYRIAFTPSLAALRVVVEQADQKGIPAEHSKSESLLNVAFPGTPNTRSYLENVLPEAKAIARHFARVTPLYTHAATPDAVLGNARGQDVIHMGCHGWFDPEDPDQSGLWLAEGWLTVERIFTELRLDRTRLASLSACLSGRLEVRSGEEHVGLLQAMLSAGARAVVSSLWAVNDAATRALFEAFYSQLAADNFLADALVSAAQEVSSYQKWEHPYYWAAFQANGLAHGPGAPGRKQLPTEVVRRIEEAHEESVGNMRGGLAVNKDRMVSDSLILLEQMSEYPKEVVAALAPAERKSTLENLRSLEEQSTGVQNEEELLALADAINRLVEKTPALAALLLPEGMDMGAAQEERRITLQDYRGDAPKGQFVQEHAPQIRNHIIECRMELERLVQGLSPDEQGQK